VLVHKAIERGLLRPELTDAEFVAQLLWAGMHGIAALRISCPEHAAWIQFRPVQALGAEMSRDLMVGLIRQPSAKPSRRAARATPPRQRPKRRR
jgi:hypothetical protein